MRAARLATVATVATGATGATGAAHLRVTGDELSEIPVEVGAEAGMIHWAKCSPMAFVAWRWRQTAVPKVTLVMVGFLVASSSS